MRTPRTFLHLLFVLGVSPTLLAQPDGDHTTTNGLGWTFLAPDANVGGGLVPPYNMTIGTVASDFATLRVRGDQLPVTDPLGIGFCTFRTDVASARTQSWRMMRDVNDIGVLWNENNHVAFHVQSGMPRDDGQDRYSGLFLQNHLDDGMWIMNDGPPTGGRAFPNVLQLLDAKGFAALGHLSYAWGPGTGNPRGPWSRLHFFHDNSGTPPWFAHRSQMRNGITLTGNSDHAYIGQWYDQGTDGIEAEVDDNSNLVIAVSENALPAEQAHKWDNISFRHFSDLSGGDGAASSVEGLEMVRIQPSRKTVEDRVEGFVGIGDFLSATEVPEERLDILDRTLRIRSMGVPGLYQNDGLSRVMVVDPTDGRVYWREVSTIGSGGGSGCNWQYAAASNRMYTAFDPISGSSCPQIDWTVGIGTNTSAYKLDVYHSESSGSMPGGLRVDLRTNSAGWRDGIASYVQPVVGGTNLAFGRAMYASITNLGLASAGVADGYGLLAKALTNQNLFVRHSYGVSADAEASVGTVTSLYGGNFTGRGTGATVTNAYGTYNKASGATNNYSVYGASPGAGANDWAGFMNGRTFTPGGLWTLSDSEFKTNIQAVEDPLDLLMGVQIHTFEFLTAEHPNMGLPQGEQFGVLAPELEQVFPQMVTDAVLPAELDTAGNEVVAAMPFKAVNLTALLPLTIAAVQQQDARMDALEATLAQALDQLAACCANNDGTRSFVAGGATGSRLENELRIVPNPVADRTELRYTMAIEGHVRLEVTDASSRIVLTQEEGQRTAGSFVYEWDTTMLAPGTYFCTLYINDEFLVKKSVKLGLR